MNQQNKSSPSRHIERETLEFVNHHHIEMQKMLDNLLTHPTIIKSSTHKDLQYLSSKLSYIQSKVSILTNGKTATTSPPGLHSQRNSHYRPSELPLPPTQPQNGSHSPESINSPTIATPISPDTDINHPSISDAYHIQVPPKHKHNKAQHHHAMHPNVHNLSSQSSPYKTVRKS